LAKVLPVLENPVPLNRSCYLGYRGNLSVWENVLVDPGVSAGRGRPTADGVEQKDALRTQGFMYASEVGRVVFVTNMLKHSNGHDLIEGFIQIAIVL
jgi:hypothetical protein